MKIMKFVRTGPTSGGLLLHYWLWYFIRYSNHPEKYPIEKRFELVRKASIRILRPFRVDLHYKGYENLQKMFDSDKGTLIICNHISAFDVLTLMIFCKDHPVRFVAKKELETTPLLGRSVRSIDSLFLDREDPRQAIKILQETTEILKSGGYVVIFPEGKRNKDPLNTPLGEFHPGSFKCGVRAESNILCVSLFGSFRYLDSKTNYRSNLVNISFDRFIPAEELKGKNTMEVSSMCYDILNSSVDEMKEEDKKYLAEGKHRHFSKNKWWKDPKIK